MDVTADDGAGAAQSPQAVPHQQAARDRALQIRDVLVDLWGEELPPGQDAVVRILSDAVVVDDEAGSAAGVVVQSDGLPVDVLTELVWGSGGSSTRLALLPGGLRSRLRAPS